MTTASAHAVRGTDVAVPAREMALVRAWLIALAVLVVIMVGVGGATRLTGSGLSITEWRPVTGAIPPLTHQAWLEEFAKYREIPQYELLNQGLSLAEFKFIYWWEWSHRQLGRLIGLAFFVPLLWFWLRGWVRGKLALALLGIGCLGALQGAVGWLMVASGLEPGMIAVAPIKLALHLTIASLIVVWLVWIATGLDDRARQDGEARTSLIRVGAYCLVGLVLIQITLGGLVAGSKAGFTNNTWPLMDGQLVPPASVLFSGTPWLENFVDNLALVQFNHRLAAYLIIALAIGHAVTAWRLAPDSSPARRAGVLSLLCVAQMTLGIVTLVLVVPLWAGLAHQLLAMGILVWAVVHARRCAGAQPHRS